MITSLQTPVPEGHAPEAGAIRRPWWILPILCIVYLFSGMLFAWIGALLIQPFSPYMPAWLTDKDDHLLQSFIRGAGFAVVFPMSMWIGKQVERRLGFCEPPRVALNLENLRGTVKTTEIETRRVCKSERTPKVLEPILEIGPRQKWFDRCIIALVLTCTNLVFLSWVFDSSQKPGNRLLGAMGSLVLTIPNWCCLIGLFLPYAYLDEHVVSGYQGFWRRTILWERVAACDLITVRSNTGWIASITPVFKDADGRVLMKLNTRLWFVSRADRNRIVAYIRRRLGETVGVDD